MSRGVRLLGAVAVACASLPLVGVGAAHAESASLVPSNAAYFYSQGLDKPDAAPAAPPNVTGDADGVSAGNLAVAAQGGQEDKVSFLYFDVFGLPAGATIEKAVVTMKLVALSPTDVTAQAAPEKVQACKAGDKGFSGDDGAGLAKNAPARLCKDFSAKGTAAPGAQAYQWDITGLASTWVSGSNDGVAFTRADESPNGSFQVVFDKAATATLAVEYSLPVAEAPPVVDVPVVVTPPLTPSAGQPEPGGFAPAPDTGLVPAPNVDAVPSPSVIEPPAVVAPTQAQPSTRTVAAVSTSMRPTTGFWLAALALAVGLGLLSMIFGDSRVPAAAQSRSRLSQALAANQRLGAGQSLRRPSLTTLPGA